VQLPELINKEDGAKRICNVAISHGAQTYQLIWIGMLIGEFYAKSACHMNKNR
jgi:hypothetical protein